MSLPFDLGRNPFQLLGIRTDASIDEISETCDDRVFEGSIDEAVAAEVRQVLLPPRSRLEAEISWLADEPADFAPAVLQDLLEGDFAQAIAVARNLAPLAQANAAAHLVGRFKSRSEPLVLLIEAWSRIRPEAVIERVKESRRRARSPMPNPAHVDEALRKLSDLHASQVLSALQANDTAGARLTGLVQSEVNADKKSPLLSKIVREYGRATEPRLSAIREIIDAQVKRIREQPLDAGDAVEKLSQLLQDWIAINKPVQLTEQSAGHEEPRSRAICIELRKLAIWLANEKLQHRDALALTKALLLHFPELDSITAQLRKDKELLEQLVRQLPAPKPRPTPRGGRRRTQDSPWKSKPSSSHPGLEVSSSWSVGFGWLVFLLIIGLVAWALDQSDPPSRADPTPQSTRAPQPETGLPVAPTPPSPPRSAQAPESAPDPAGARTAQPDEHVPARPREVAPPPNAGRALRSDELRYCEFQSVRIDSLRPMLNRTSDVEIREFNELVDDFNSRCGEFTYRRGALSPIQAEARERRAELREDAEAILAGWRQNAPASRPGAPAATVTEPAGEVAPPPSPGRALSNAELRYCVFQGARIDVIRPMLNTFRDVEIREFNGLVDNFNSRCAQFTYLEGTLSPIQAEARERSAELRREAEAMVARWRQNSPSASRPAPQEPLMSLSNPDDARRIQRELQRLGLYLAGIDGQFGPISRSALREFQRRHSLPGNGSWNIETQRRLFGQ